MLSAADADLIARGPGIPGLATILDPEAFAAALQARFPEVSLTVLHARYARYKAGTNCLVAYVVQAAGIEMEVYAKALAAGGRVKLPKCGRRMTVPGPTGTGGAVLDDLSMAVYFYPNDHHLRALSGFAGRQSRASLLAQVVPGRPDLACGPLSMLRYKPERRYVGRVAGDGRRDAVVRVHDTGDFAAAQAAAHAFTSGRVLRIAEVIGGSDCHRILAHEWLPGTPLDVAVQSPDFQPSAMEQVAVALRELHEQPAHLLPAANPRAMQQRLQAVTGALAALRPQLAARARRLSQALRSQLSTPPPSMGAIHGDFSADQVILASNRVGIIDLDAARHGDPTEDLGSFAAHAHREVVRGKLPADRAQAMVDELLRAYSSGSAAAFADRFRLNFAAMLVCLSPSPFRYREQNWEQRSEALLARAEEVMGHA